MESKNGWVNIREAIISILKNVGKYHRTLYGNDIYTSCYLSAYQIAVILLKNYKSLIDISDCPQNIGGKDDGENESLAKYIARNLSIDIRDEKLKDIIDMQFFNTNGLEQFSFIDEKGILSQPSNTCFSMFRYIKET